MRKTWIAVLLLWTAQVPAQTWVSPDCEVTWSPPTEGAPVQGYRVYFEKQSPYELSNFNVGLNTRFACAVANLSTGSWKAWVTAFNIVGESGPSNVVPFELVTSAPGSPVGVSIGEKPNL